MICHRQLFVIFLLFRTILVVVDLLSFYLSKHVLGWHLSILALKVDQR